MYRVGLETDNRELAEYLADAFHDCARSIEDERDADDGSMFDLLEEARSIMHGMSEDLYWVVKDGTSRL